MAAPAVLLAVSGPNDLTLLARVAVAAVAGLVVGWERDLRSRAAGGRTFGLMATGAAVFTVAGVAFPGEAGRVIAGVATGVGFIGAGLVWRGHANDVHGLTTAAAVWAMVAVGVLAGVGHPILAAAVTVMVLLLLEIPFTPVIRLLDPARLAHRFRGEAGQGDPALTDATDRSATPDDPPGSELPRGA
jgi:putative Mg2+ transporter-C (MgtC) family protein